MNQSDPNLREPQAVAAPPINTSSQQIASLHRISSVKTFGRGLKLTLSKRNCSPYFFRVRLTSSTKFEHEGHTTCQPMCCGLRCFRHSCATFGAKHSAKMPANLRIRTPER